MLSQSLQSEPPLKGGWFLWGGLLAGEGFLGTMGQGPPNASPCPSQL